jgi:aspartate/glutamate racemase
MKNAAIRLERGGADFVLICNAPDGRCSCRSHQYPISAHSGSDCAEGIKKVGLLNTAFTMEQDF